MECGNEMEFTFLKRILRYLKAQKDTKYRQEQSHKVNDYRTEIQFRIMSRLKAHGNEMEFSFLKLLKCS